MVLFTLTWKRDLSHLRTKTTGFGPLQNEMWKQPLLQILEESLWGHRCNCFRTNYVSLKKKTHWNSDEGESSVHMEVQLWMKNKKDFSFFWWREALKKKKPHNYFYEPITDLKPVLLKISVLVYLVTPVVTGAVWFDTTDHRIDSLNNYFIRNTTEEQLVFLQCSQINCIFPQTM